MNFWKKLFAGMGFVCGFLVFETMSLAYHNSRRRHKNRKGRCRHNSFWNTLTRYMIFAWIYDGVKKSREQVGRRYYRRTGNEFRPSYDSGTRRYPSESAKAAPKAADAAQPKKQRSAPSTPKTAAKTASASTADRLKVPAAEAKPPRETTAAIGLKIRLKPQLLQPTSEFLNCPSKIRWYVLHCNDSKNKGEVFCYDLQKAIRSTV